MKEVFALCALLFSLFAYAQNVTVKNETLGSGRPGEIIGEAALPVDVRSGTHHAPQYMPGHPTAATIWPRAVEVPCVRAGDALKCEGYKYSPSMGRAEYLFVVPKLVETPEPVVVVKEKLVPVPAPYPVYVEVQKKKE